jgi:V-type H+-transporting ATPase subunit a
MGELFRSEEMTLVQLFVQIEAAHDTVDELGQLGLIQFRDLNSQVNAFQRNFVNEVKRSDEMLRKLTNFANEIDLANTELSATNSPPILVQRGDEPLVELQLDELETKFEELDKELEQFRNNQDNLERSYNDMVELKYVLEKDSNFFAEAAAENFGGKGGRVRDDAPLITDEESVVQTSAYSGVKLGFVTGVVPRDKFSVFERVLFRATRGNLYMKYAEIEEPLKDNGQSVLKNVFIIFFQGERLQTKIKKICESFGSHLHPCPDTAQERRDLGQQVRQKLDDLKIVLARTQEHRRQLLANIALHLESWRNKVTKEKWIYHTMNLFNYDLGRKCLIAEGWCPKSSIEEVQLALRRARDRSGALVPSILNIIRTKETPPTYFKTNKFTAVYQDIVDAYGIARYREVNPAVFSMVTFPFLFAVMFGDVGHGFILLAFAIFLLIKEKQFMSQQLNEMMGMVFSGRYMLLLMGIFSIYIGLIYNEFLSVPLNLFGTNWEVDPDGDGRHFRLIDMNRTYPFGVDPVWKGAENELGYYNSLKMKMSILLGVSQMVLGIFMKLLNAIYFRSDLDVAFEFIPQLVFMLSIFGYLCFLILYKWFVPYMQFDMMSAGEPVDHTCAPDMGKFGCSPAGTQCAPALLNVLIYMFLAPTDECASKNLFPGQKTTQLVLLVLALVSIPVMLLVKPLVLRHRHNKSKAAYEIVRDDDMIINKHDEHSEDSHSERETKKEAAHSEGGHGHGHGDEEFDFGEFMIHQLIETIEFVLGAVSNTASYLRLWALSLAHSELSTVFWDMLLINTIKSQWYLALFGIAVWFGVTMGVLMTMESLSAFLHALRLHWVEYMNKFYKGDGKKFIPFSYRAILAGEVNE